MKKFIIKTLGCKVNQYDSVSLRNYLSHLGLDYSQEDGPDIDVAIVNSCAVTKTSIRKGRRMLSLIKRDNPNAKIILLGCWAKTYPEEMKDLEVDLIWEVGDLDNLARKIEKLINPFQSSVKNLDVVFSVVNKIKSPGEGERSRYFLKIQDGCEQFCSYCIIPYSRGKLSSKPREEVLLEVEAAIAAGYDEIVLCGIHLGLYGKEIESKTCDLKKLLSEIIEIPKLGRVRLSSIEVNDVDDELLLLMAKSDKICKHLHFPLQSGSDNILSLMNRPYDTGYFRKRVEEARKLMPKIALTTDVIVGFPGETEENFQDTYDFCRDMQFSRIHVFPFSAHEKTPAATMTGQLTKEQKNKRAKKLRLLGEKMEKTYRNSFGDVKFRVILERVGEELVGKTEFYFDVKQKKNFQGNEKILKIGKFIELEKTS